MGEHRRQVARIPDSLAEATVLRQLHRILASSVFNSADRMSRFLRYVLEETLAGRADRLKEYALGLAVFDRPADFDPRTDPIVRVEARRLRSKLAAYYDGEGAADELVIDLPKGGYAPLVRARDEKQPAANPVSAKSDTIRLAILPFANFGVNGEDEYFSEGLTEELIHLLTKVPSLQVIAWGSSSRLRGEGSEGRVREQLNVDYVLRGSVRRVMSQVRVTAQLIEAQGDRYVWSEVYERGLDDVMAIEHEIAGAITSKLRLEIHPSSVAAPHPSVPVCGSEEHTLYLKGRFHARKRTVEGLERSIQCYEQAIAIQPSYFLAHAAMADSLSLVTIYGVRYPAETVPLARRAAERALAGDAQAQAAANASLGLITGMHDHQWALAEQLFRKAIELDPSYAEAHHWLACDLLAPLGRFDEAIELLSVAQRLDPLNAVIAESRGYVRMLQRRYDEALADYQVAMEVDPNFHLTNSSIGRVYTLMGKFDEALVWMCRARELAGESYKLDAALGQTLWLAGRREEALRTLQRLKDASHKRFVPATAMAVLLSGMGQLEAAVDWLERAVANGEFSAAFINVHPVYDPLRGLPRFQELLRRLNFPAASLR